MNFVLFYFDQTTDMTFHGKVLFLIWLIFNVISSVIATDKPNELVQANNMAASDDSSYFLLADLRKFLNLENVAPNELKT